MYEEIAKQNGNAQHVACQATRIVRLLHRAMKQASLRNPRPLGSAGINKALHCILQLVFFRAQCSFCFFCFFGRFLVFRVFSLSFLYFPFMVLHFLFSTFSSILCFLAVFRIISRASSILGSFPSILLLCFTMLRFCLFLSIGYMLLSFRYILWFGMTNKQKNLTQSVHQARSFPRCILHNYFCHCSPCLLRSSICPFDSSRLICHNIHICAWGTRFCRENSKGYISIVFSPSTRQISQTAAEI